MRPPSVLLAALLAAPALAQANVADNAGFGGVYRDVALDAVTGNVLHLGVAVAATTGRIYVSATGLNGLPPHRIYEFDAQGGLRTSFTQPAAQSQSAFGMRDLDSDGQSLLGGSDVGISVVSTAGAHVNVLQAQNGPQPIAQPIGGAALQQLGVLRALAFDRAGNGGNGSLLVANFGSPILECDLQGNVLRSIPNGGWHAYGLALDPRNGNLWVNDNGAGAVVEIDRASGALTGRALPTLLSGAAPGGLAVASAAAGHHEPWAAQLLLAHVEQAATGADHLIIQRVDLYPGVGGHTEPVLRVGTNGGALVRGTALFRAGDMLNFKAESPTGVGNGGPCWSFFNLYGDAAVDGYTSLASLFPGGGQLPEFRCLNFLSTPFSPVFINFAGQLGSTTSVQLPPTFFVATGDLLRMQTLYFQPASVYGMATTNEAHFRGFVGVHGIVVAATGANSFQSDPTLPFWSVSSDGTHNHGAILAVEFDFATGSSAHVFDLDQPGMADRFDGGNSSAVGCRGTYRNGCDVWCGLDYAAAGAYRNPVCHQLPGESGGFIATLVAPGVADATAVRFQFSAFTPGKTFAFDCDTDGGLASGDGHAGTIVRVVTANSGTLIGALQPDPLQSDRAFVYFP